MIYLDYAASTPIASEVAEAMIAHIGNDNGCFSNPSAKHVFGREVCEQIEVTRQCVADLVNAESREIIFTSCATESINLAIRGLVGDKPKQDFHIITSLIEHSATLEVCRYLGKQGVSVTYLKPDSHGLISVSQVERAIRPETKLVSLHWVNNEVGSVLPIRQIGQLCRKHNIILHADAVQAVGKMSIDVIADNVDLLSLSAHKFYGPKGVGVLYVRKGCSRLRLQPLLYGGGHERGLRPGTLATHQIIGLGVAARLAQKYLNTEPQRLLRLKRQLWRGIQEKIPGAKINGELDRCFAPHILNVVLPGVDLDKLMQQVACSLGSACHSGHVSASHVLIAMGVSAEEAKQSVRLSLGVGVQFEDIQQFLTLVKAC